LPDIGLGSAVFGILHIKGGIERKEKCAIGSVGEMNGALSFEKQM
jgi:hypothetical protein